MAESKAVKAPVPAAKRDRSPNYPAISFTEALDHAETIWRQEKRNPVSTDMACQHLGYKAKNGASLPIIGALKRYGLLISAGSDLRISDEANTICLAPKDHPERKALIRRLAMRPALFSEVLQRFPDGLPSDENLRFRLRQDWDFATDKAADNFIKSLKDAVALAGPDAAGESSDAGRSDPSNERSQTLDQKAINPAQSAPPVRNGPIQATILPNAQTRSWDLGSGSIVSISLPAKLSKGNIEKLKKYVGALEIEASISWDEDNPDA